MTNGLRPYPIALDNYFVNREDTPRDVNGDYDYESLYALDLKKFEEDLKALLRGEEIDLPSFNFSTGQREYKGDKLRIDEHTILILEGIHALNPELTPQIPAENKYKIYVSALTTISLDDHNWIPTTDNRLLRRIIRDFNYRGIFGTRNHLPLAQRACRRRQMDLPLPGERRCDVQLRTTV